MLFRSDLANTNTVYVDGVKQSDNIKTWLTTNGEGNATYGKGSDVYKRQAQGIISGVGGGRFSPNGNVTGTQLAKMLLVSLGYNANTEGFVGNAWATNVNVIASQKGLYEGLESMDTSAALTRDNACLLYTSRCV